MKEETHLDLWGHLGYIILLLGVYLLGEKSASGWVCYIVGDSIWLYVGLKKKMSSIWFWQIPFILAAFYGLYEWL